MRPLLFRCPCGADVPSGLIAPPSHPRAVDRRPVLRVERRCPSCGRVAEFAAAEALLA